MKTVETSPKDVMPLSDTAALRNLFNTTLKQDFPGYVIGDSAQIWKGMETPTISVSPGPSTLTLLAVGLTGLAGYRLRRRKQSAA
jgi:MYXO-CTERM domain-containing protein